MNMCVMKLRLLLAGLPVLLLLLIAACTPDPVDEDGYTYNPTPYASDMPSWMPPMEIPADNPTTVQGVQLGRML